MSNDAPNDDILDERIRALAVERFNAPDGEPPREAMWNEIAAARRAARAATASAEAAPAPAPANAPVIAIDSRRRHAAAWRWAAALAAGLLLGIAVDRAVVRRDPAPTNVAQAPAAPSNGTAPPVRADSPAVVQPAPAPVTRRTIEQSPRREVASNTPTPAPARTPNETTSTSAPQRVATRAAEPADSTTQLFYRTAAAQTFVQAEALLTAYRRADDGARDPQALRQAARWARDVLSSTRLLIDSPAGRDPQMRALFTDLELVLAQIVQLSGTPLQASERELIERAMRDRDLLPRLRSVVPAGLAAS